MSTATTAATLPALKDFRPIDGTSTAVRAALDKLAAARAANAAEVERMEGTRPGLLLTATTAEIERTDEALRRRRIFAEQLDLLEPELLKMAAEAQKNEENQEYIERFAEVKGRADAWNERLRAEYPVLRAAFEPLFAEEAEIRDAIEALTRMPGAYRVGGENARNMYYASRMMIEANRHSIWDHGTKFGVATVFPPIPDR